MVGLIPLFAVETLEPEVLDKLPGFKKRLEWFIDNRPDLTEHTACMQHAGQRAAPPAVDRDAGSAASRAEGHARREGVLLALRHPRAVARAPREAVRAGDRRAGAHSRLRAGRIDDRPVRRQLELARSDLVPGQFSPRRIAPAFPLLPGRRLHGGVPHRLRPADESQRGRGGIVAAARAPLLRDATGRRPVHGNDERFQNDPHWRDLVLFYEYFHGDNGRGVGASHQTGWTGLVAKLLQQSGERVEKTRAEEQDLEVGIV